MARRVMLVLVMAAVGLGVPLKAQTVGSFTWQLQPFCNVVTVTITQQGGVYTLDGFDDQCGAAQRAPLVGMATINPDGTIGFGLHIVTVPSGRSVSVEARISVQSLSGPWSDGAGNSGTFVFNGAGGGSPRPAPTIPGAMIAPGSLTSAQFAPGAIAAAAAGFGTCPAGQYLRGIQASGTVICEPIGVPPSTSTPDATASSGAYSSLAIGTDGLAIISHYASNVGDLVVAHCSNPECSSATSVLVDTSNDVGRYTSIAIGHDGLPIIAYQDVTNGDLRVTHCGTIRCDAGNVSTSIDTASTVGVYASLAIGSDNLPVISHHDSILRNAKVTHCSNVTCTAATTLTIDSANDVGRYGSITIGSDRLPIVAYRDETPGDLRVTHCTTVTCSARTTATVVSAGNVGYYTSLAIGTDGLPLIAHEDGSNGYLVVTHCQDVACANVTSANADTDSVVGQMTSLAIGSDGLPIVSHWGQNDSDLRVTHCSNAACSVATSTTASAAGVVGYFSSMAIGPDGLPIISHGGTGGLLVTKCNSRTCK